MWGALPDERTGLPFTIAVAPRQRSHSQVRDPRDSWTDFTVSDSRLPQPGGPGPRIYILQKQGAPVIPPGTGFPFRRLLRLAELRTVLLITSRHRPHRKHRFRCYSPAIPRPLHSNGCTGCPFWGPRPTTGLYATIGLYDDGIRRASETLSLCRQKWDYGKCPTYVWV
jgi:hypothetical protein